MGMGAQGRRLHFPPVSQHWAYVRVRSSEKCLPFLRTELENQVDLAESGGGVDTAFVVVSLAAWGESVQAPHPTPPSSLCGWKVPENLRSCSGWLSRLRCHLCRGQTRDRRENKTPQSPQGRGPGSLISMQGPQVWASTSSTPAL